MAKNPISEAQALGHSIWYDNINRELLTNGKLKKYVERHGIRGITSNPTIFMHAIANTSFYDNTIATLLDHSPEAIYEALAIEDIQQAADLLRPIYDETQAYDGYASFEVSPLVAEDTEKTIAEAKRLFAAIDRPNVMIKIPANNAGLPAIEACIFAGVNVNVTLIFNVENYKLVVERYLTGLERRQAAGLPIDTVASVASFFLSRIDQMVDLQLSNNIRAAQGWNLEQMRESGQLLGRIAIANARLAYQEFKRIFYKDSRFATLQEAGAMVQRPLWASMGVKDLSYSPTLYVESLIGQDTVSTLPHETYRAFRKQGTVDETLEDDLPAIGAYFHQLKDIGIEFDAVTRMLQTDGIDAFEDAYEKLLMAIEGKSEMLRVGIIQRQQGVVGGYEPGVRHVINELDEKHATRAIWQRDPRFWKEVLNHQDIIRNRLGWLDGIEHIDLNRLKKLQAQRHQWTHVVLLGMGGSSFAPKVFADMFGDLDAPLFIMLDSTDPARVKTVEDKINLASTLFIVASKSGTTIETDSFRRYFYAQCVALKGETDAGSHFIAITDPETSLADIAERDHYYDVFLNPTDIGGRYSALSYFGLVPAALLGIDLDRLTDYVNQMQRAISEVIPTRGNPAIWLGALMGYLATRGRDKLGLLCSEGFASFPEWIEQLIAESTGKEGKGILPVVASTMGYPHDYDDDRLLIYLRLDGESEATDQQVQNLWEAGLPVFTIHIPDRYAVAGEFLRWEFATAVAGHLLGVNPFDEPNVQESKDNTLKLLKRYEKKGSLPFDEPFITDDNVELYVNEYDGEMLYKIAEQRNYSNTDLAGLLAAHISFARSGDYIAILAYLEPNPEHGELLREIRRRMRHTTTRAVTRGYGPRYLHSTGQLHKGGGTNGLFIQITVDDPIDLEIPDKPYSFSTLKQAQAMGDQQALVERRLPFVRLHIKGHIADGLNKILDAIQVAEEKQH